MQNQTKTRAQIDPKYTWRLEDIFETDEAWEEAYAGLEGEIAAFAAGHGEVSGPEAVVQAVSDKFALQEKLERVFAYARMRQDEDNKNAKYQGLCDRAQGILVRYGTELSFLEPALLALDPSVLARAKELPQSADYRVFLDRLERRRKHTLSAEQERLVAMTGEMGMTPDTVYGMLTDADMKFPAITGEDGQSVEVTHGRYSSLIRSANRQVRRQAYEAMFETHKSFGNTFAALYSGQIKADVFYARAANHGSTLEASLFSDAVPTQVYHNLIAATHAHFEGLHKYVDLKKRALGVEEMQMYDLYVPLTDEYDMKMNYEEAYQLVIDSLAPLGSEYQRVLKQAFDMRWIDVYESEGKTSGAYSFGVFGVHPYVLLNFEPTLDAALTIAHEMGHTMHSHLSCLAQPYSMTQYSIFVAEVASTVNEVLMTRALLEKLGDNRQARAYLLCNMLEQFRTTLFRQVMFAEFEYRAHQMAENAEGVTAESLNRLYGQINQEYYAPVNQGELIQYEWMRIPHFYRSYYVYQYATGYAAAVAIAERILREGQSAVDDYIRFLSAGDSLFPIDALKIAGVDMESTQPVDAALRYFDQLVDQLDALTGGK